MGKSEESDLVGLSFGDVTPGIPGDLKCEPETRQVQLTWKVPAKNGNAAKYFEISIKHNNEWKVEENCVIHQKRNEGTLTYHAIVEGLSPSTSYEFSVQAVNNSTKNILVGESAIVKAETKNGPPEKPSCPTVKFIDEQKAQVAITLLSREQMNGSCVNEIILDCNGTELTRIDITHEEHTEKTLSREVTIPSLLDPKIITYCFQVRMINKVGESKPSDPFNLPVSQFKPGPPTNIRTVAVSAHSIKFAWETPNIHPALVTQYHLEYYQYREELFKSELYTVENKYEICRLQSNQKYTIKITAIASKTNRSKSARVTTLTQEIYPGPPTSLYVDKIGSDSVKVRWRKPRENPQEVVFYFIELRKGDDTGTVQKTKRVLGTSTVLKELESYTAYTVSVSTCNDNKERSKNSIVHAQFSTKMSKTAKHLLQALTAPSVAGPFILSYSQATDVHMYDSDEEFPTESGVYPGRPEALKVSHYCLHRFTISWRQPKKHSNELWYYNVTILKEKDVRATEHIKCYYPQTSLTHIFNPDIEYTVRVTSINYNGEEDPKGATTNLKGVFNGSNEQLTADVESL